MAATIKATKLLATATLKGLGKMEGYLGWAIAIAIIIIIINIPNKSIAPAPILSVIINACMASNYRFS